MPAKEALGTALYSSGYFEKALMMFHKINRYSTVHYSKVRYTVQYSAVQCTVYSTISIQQAEAEHRIRRVDRAVRGDHQGFSARVQH